MDNFGIDFSFIFKNGEKVVQQVRSFGNIIEKIKGDISKPVNIEVEDTSIYSIERSVRALEEAISDTADETKVLDKELKSMVSTGANLNSQVSGSNFAFKNMASDIEKATTKIKRFALSLLSVRGAFTLISRATRSYLTQDIELTDQLKNAWIGLGAVFAPILEAMVKGIVTVVKYITIFVKALTGIDLLSRAINKSMAGVAKNTKAAAKNLAPFDEIVNLSSGAGTAADLGAFGASLKDTFDDIELNSGIVAFLEKIGTSIREMWIKASPIFNKMGKRIIEIGTKFKNWVISDSFQERLGIVLGILGDIGQKAFDVSKNIYDSYKQFLEPVITQELLPALGQVIDLIGAIWTAFKPVFAAMTRGFKDTVTNGIFFFSSALRGIIPIFRDMLTFLTSTFKGEWGRAWEDLKNIFINIWARIAPSLKGELNGIIGFFQSMINGIIFGFNKLKSTINSLKLNIPAIFGGGSIGFNLQPTSGITLPRLDAGTNYVPHDMVANIHKGEAVIPKDFNSSEFLGGGGSETNDLLRELISKLDEKDFNAYISQDSVGQAANSYNANKSRALGRAVG